MFARPDILTGRNKVDSPETSRHNDGMTPRNMVAATIALILALCGGLLTGCGSAASQEPGSEPRTSTVVYAASGLERLLPPLFESYAKSGPQHEVEASYEGSRALALQIEAGGTLDLFIAADEKTVAEMSRRPSWTTPWLRNRLVLIASKGNDKSFDQLLAGEGLIALGTEGTPIGDFSRLGLRRQEKWDLVRSRSIQLVDANAVIGQVVTGSAVCGIVYETDAKLRSADVRIIGTLDLPEGVEVKYVLASYSDAGRRLGEWLASDVEVRAAAGAAGFETLPAAAPGR